MDVLSDVMSWLRVSGSVTRRSEFSAPWGISYPVSNLAAFLMIEKGSCYLLLKGEEALKLEAGDLVMFSPGHHCSLVDSLSTPAVPYSQILEESPLLPEEKYPVDQNIYPTLTYGGGGAQTTLRGWGLHFDSYEQHPLLSLLPPYIHITYSQRSALPWLETILRFMNHETLQREEGSDMTIIRLVDLLFVQIIRTWLKEQPEGKAGWLGALRDSSISRALKLIHQYPAEPWTVESLGKTVGMSRSNFSSRFQTLVGSSPMKYLTQLRMHHAANALKGDDRLSLSQIAAQVGYDTDSSFSRAFKRYFHLSPAAFRKQQGR